MVCYVKSMPISPTFGADPASIILQALVDVEFHRSSLGTTRASSTE